MLRIADARALSYSQPSAVSAAVKGVQASIDNMRGTTGNFLSTSGSVDEMGHELLVAVGQSVDILNHTNQLASISWRPDH